LRRSRVAAGVRFKYTAQKIDFAHWISQGLELKKCCMIQSVVQKMLLDRSVASEFCKADVT